MNFSYQLINPIFEFLDRKEYLDINSHHEMAYPDWYGGVREPQGNFVQYSSP